LERARKAGISIPIIGGIMSITNFEKIKQFARMCGATIPQKLNQTMTKIKHSLEETKRIGIDYAVRQCEDLLKNGVSYFPFLYS
jgi:methylenetetrahydrofolate reductase (NADPH)